MTCQDNLIEVVHSVKLLKEEMRTNITNVIDRCNTNMESYIKLESHVNEHMHALTDKHNITCDNIKRLSEHLIKLNEKHNAHVNDTIKMIEIFQKKEDDLVKIVNDVKALLQYRST